MRAHVFMYGERKSLRMIHCKEWAHAVMRSGKSEIWLQGSLTGQARFPTLILQSEAQRQSGSRISSCLGRPQSFILKPSANWMRSTPC